jgi:hypothetical protein
MLYRTDACKGVGIECGRTDGGSKKSTAKDRGDHLGRSPEAGRNAGAGSIPAAVDAAKGNVGASAGRLHSSFEVPTQSPASVPAAKRKRGRPVGLIPFDKKAHDRNKAAERRERERAAKGKVE